jgi:YidC/Oxa1 family membrane protein insertase
MNFDFLFTAFGSVMAALYELRHSYAFMIAGLTLIVMVIVTPLTLKATRSMLMMQQLQPELKKIQSQYKDDRQRLNEELLKFYKENNINPVGGCLPLIVQTPVFLVLYAVLRGVNMRVPVMGSNTGWVTGQLTAHLPLTTPPDVVHSFEPMYLPTDSTLYQNLINSTEMRSLGMDLSASAQQVLQISIWQSIPYFLLIAVVAVTGVVQQRQIQGRNTGTPINPQQQTIMKIMPFFLPVFSFALPAGLVLYFAVSNTYRVGQQWFISRNIYGVSKDKDGEPKRSSLADRVPGLQSILGRGGEPAAKETTLAVRETKRPAAKAGAATGAKSTSAKAGAAPAKAKAGTATKAERNGGARPSPGTKGARTSSRTSNAPGSSSGRVTSTSKPVKKASSTEPAESTERPATLQPRARKNKKR